MRLGDAHKALAASLALALTAASLSGLSAVPAQAAQPQAEGDAVSTAQPVSGFSDVPAGHTFAQEIGWLASTGVTQVRGDGSFGVNDAVTRGAMAAFPFPLRR